MGRIAKMRPLFFGSASSQSDKISFAQSWRKRRHHDDRLRLADGTVRFILHVEVRAHVVGIADVTLSRLVALLVAGPDGRR